MAILLALMLQVAIPWSDPVLPPLLDQERADEGEQPIPGLDFINLKVFGVDTNFDSGLRIDDARGYGADIEIGNIRKGKTVTGLSVGYAGWNTENDTSRIWPPDDVQVRQYRVGAWIELTSPWLELGLALNVGAYRFRRTGENDTSPYAEFEGTLGVRPIPELKFGVIGMATHTQSSFNHKRTHFYHNYSVGFFVEYRF